MITQPIALVTGLWGEYLMEVYSDEALIKSILLCWFRAFSRTATHCTHTAHHHSSSENLLSLFQRAAEGFGGQTPMPTAASQPMSNSESKATRDGTQEETQSLRVAGTASLPTSCTQQQLRAPRTFTVLHSGKAISQQPYMDPTMIYTKKGTPTGTRRRAQSSTKALSIWLFQLSCTGEASSFMLPQHRVLSVRLMSSEWINQ